MLNLNIMNTITQYQVPKTMLKKQDQKLIRIWKNIQSIQRFFPLKILQRLIKSRMKIKFLSFLKMDKFK